MFLKKRFPLPAAVLHALLITTSQRSTERSSN